MTMKKLFWLCLALAVLAALAWSYDNYSGYLFAGFDRKRYPSIQTTSSLAQSLEADMQRKRLNAFNAESRRVAGLVSAAASQGHNVSALYEKLQYAARVAEAGRFREAMMFVNLVEVRIPKKREALTPATGDEEPPPDPGIPGKAVKRKRSRR
ncbi:MAG TPA: hypothetical protein DCM05_01885 [Elusimicrobia bacterium]|nr:hypothetical protein [Elusimicrobiota bacterium]